jgi:hypothetical protein
MYIITLLLRFQHFIKYMCIRTQVDYLNYEYIFFFFYLWIFFLLLLLFIIIITYEWSNIKYWTGVNELVAAVDSTWSWNSAACTDCRGNWGAWCCFTAYATNSLRTCGEWGHCWK